MTVVEKRIASRLLGAIADDFHERAVDLVDGEVFEGLTETEMSSLGASFNLWKRRSGRGSSIPFDSVTAAEWATFLSRRLAEGATA